MTLLIQTKLLSNRYTSSQMNFTNSQIARPFMKWAGGKGKLLPQLQKFYPAQFNNYFEPFFGGGAVFFSLKVSGTSNINDINDTLMDAYNEIRNNVEPLIHLLEKLERRYKSLTLEEQQVYFYEQRAKFNDLENSIEKTALLILLNKTCFNGLYRENKRGKFNVPFGKYVNPTICDKNNLRLVSKHLQNTSINSTSYNEAVLSAKAGDFIYFDPPYQPLHTTSSFTSYHENGFTPEDQEDLRDLFAELDKRGCYVMLSNSNAPLMLELYKNFNQHFIQAKRSINATGSKRGKIAELVVTNY